jgi:four helix bundle protein
MFAMKNYKELVIWQRGIEIVKKTYELVKSFPSEEKFGMISQITRAAVSIPANLAEGSSRQSDKDYARFVQHSLGSAFEVQTYLIIAQEMNWINKTQVGELEDLVEREIMMLHKFINTLNNQQ